MNKFRRFLLISILTFLASPIFADNWYVCLSSFTKKSNAEHLIQQMEKNDLKGCIEVSCTKGTIYFRVLLEEPFATVQEARDRRDQMKNDNFVKAYGLKGLWPCKANPENFIYVCPKGDAYSSKPEAATVSEDSVSKADVAAVTEEVVTIDEATATAIAENPAVAAANETEEVAHTVAGCGGAFERCLPLLFLKGEGKCGATTACYPTDCGCGEEGSTPGGAAAETQKKCRGAARKGRSGHQSGVRAIQGARRTPAEGVGRTSRRA